MKKEVNVGIDIGGSHISVGIVNKKGIILEQLEKYFTQEEKKKLKNVIEKFILNSINELKAKYELKKIGIGIAGTISNGVVLKSVNLNIKNYNIKEKVEKITKLKVNVKNDAKCASIAEYEFGGWKKYKNVIFLTIGTGIGGSYIYNGKLLEGEKYEGLEFGHMIIQKNGLMCNCGKRGCLEQYTSLLKFKENLIKKLELTKIAKGEEIREKMEKNPQKISKIKEEYINNLAIGISNIINIFEPEIVILGGGFAKYSYLILDDLKKQIVNSNLLFNSRKKVMIESAKLKNDAGIIGASMLS